jgi:tetratricopeptide (TPR) repeat protein
MEVCLQCHLETASRGIPDSLRRAGRGVFSYRPGEPLNEYKVYFDHAPGGGREDKFEINHAGYRLLQSACYQTGAMTCTTCHDPHRALRGEASVAHYRRACQGCHLSAHAERQVDCVSCHMPKRRAEDAVHVVMTDHRIVRKRPDRDLLAPLTEDHRPYAGEVVAYRAGAGDPEAPLYLAAAQVREANHLKPGIALLEAALRAVRPRGAAFYLDLAEAYRKAGDPERALGAARDAVRADPESGEALLALGDALLRTGRAGEAVATLERARERAPRHAVLLTTLGVAYGAAGRLDASLAALREAVARNPDLPLAWVNLGVTLEQSGRAGEAESAYREAIRIQPDFSRARRHLAALLAR